MIDPIKIIHKFKNNYNKIQYKNYIFIGSLVPDHIIKILNIIKDKDLYTTLNTISDKNYKDIVDYYGEFWYKFFFISNHINYTINIIENTLNKKKTLESKYGIEWYNKHIKYPTIKKINLSYLTLFYNNYLLFKKIKKDIYQQKDIDFRTYNLNLKNIKGGYQSDDSNDSTDSEELNIKEESSISEEVIDNTNIEDNFEKNEIEYDNYEDNIKDNLDIDTITKLYSSMDIENSKNCKEISNLISKAIDDKKWEKNINEISKDYDNSLDDLIIDTKLEDVFNKHYIVSQYIFKNDTIKNMRNKISMSIPISNKFGNSIKLLPETQYFWSEYNLKNTKDHIMIGQKWIKKNELLKIDIIPNENLKIYENLKNNLIYLKEGFNYKIKREDEDTNIIHSYDKYITSNEIFMLDIYNELNLNYNVEVNELRNLYNVYINIYFPLISYERLEQIINLLNNKNNNELDHIDLYFNNLKNDNKLDIEIENLVEKARIDIIKKDINKLFLENYIIQSIIHLNVLNISNEDNLKLNNYINLYSIFDNFIVNDKYPFIQYQKIESQIIYKFYTKMDNININFNENKNIFIKWFENISYGLSFKIKIDDDKTNNKYISINLHESGRIEYKLTWKEEEHALESDIKKSYIEIKNLLNKITLENKIINFIIPEDNDFQYAFINTIQKFNLPENYKINHNDLSEFSRFFYNYVALVIEPKKRVSKNDNINTSSKYGTYLRYKRINKYDNRNKIHFRILYFLKNYEINNKELIDEISKQFNITTSSAFKEIEYIKDKFKKVIKKSKKKLKTLSELPKSKPLGIGIDIQGRDVNKYKIRITGARYKEQLDEIIEFMKILIYLYIETYLYKNKEFIKLKDILKTLNKIAKRRNKVEDIIEYNENKNNIKDITKLDKKRLGFKPDKGQNQWTRSCQNSGTNKKRRPNIISESHIDLLIKDGYKLNNISGFYEKEISIKIKDKTYKTKIKAIKLSDNSGKYNFFTCDPSQNNEYIHIGFLSKSNNPDDLCMPCCYKKDFLTSNNKSKKEYFLKCISENKKDTSENIFKISSLGEKLYILQETNKIQEDRYIYLPKYLDIFFNKIKNNDNKIKNHYLYESNSGYFFKYTTKNEIYYFLAVISNIYEISIDEIIKKILLFLENDIDDIYFTYLNNGDIKESFKTRENFINYIKLSNYLEYDIIGELIAIPGIISDKGINFFILNKTTQIINNITKDKYILDCLNIENIEDYNINKDIIILIKENKYYFPIYMVYKNNKMKKIQILKYFNKTLTTDKPTFFNNNNLLDVLKNLNNYYNNSCKNNIINNLVYNNNLITKNLINILIKSKIGINKQYIDDRNKCVYLELDNNLIIPTIASGINYNYSFSNLIVLYTKLLLFKEVINKLNKIENIIKLNYIPKLIYYDIKDDTKINIVSILLQNNLIIPIKNQFIKIKYLKKKGFLYSYQPLEYTINKKINNYNNQDNYDEKYLNLLKNKYDNESYNLYKLELSNYLENNIDIKNTIINIVRNSKISNDDKKYKLRKLLFLILDKKISNNYHKSIDSKKSSKIKDFLSYIINKPPDLKKYITYNMRNTCDTYKNENTCNENLHCVWKNNSCKLQLIEELAISFVNKIIEEIILDDIKFKEILQENNYYVSNIIDYQNFTHRKDQKILKSSNFNINKLMSELFGKEKIPIIGRKYSYRQSKYIINEKKSDIIEIGSQLIQEIIPNKNSIIRAYVNGFYWLNNQLYDIESRNLGYESNLQNILTNYFKAMIIDFIQDILDNNNTNDNIFKYITNYINIDDNNIINSQLMDFIKKSYNTDGKLELFILSYLFPYSIIVYDNYFDIKYIFSQGSIKVTPENIKIYSKKNNNILLKFNYENSIIPYNIFTILKI